jgi:hypothetical protein
MARFTTYAEILTPDHAQMKAYTAGIQKNRPGLLLQGILERSGGAYETTTHISEKYREAIRKVAELTSDEKLLSVASLSEVVVSLEHLRHVDPQTTRIVLGWRLDYTAEESERLGLNHVGPYDPRNTILINDS